MNASLRYTPGMSSRLIPATARLVRSARSIALGLVDLCYPGRCESCSRETIAASDPLCPACESELDRLASEPSCDQCAMPLVELDDPCPYCSGEGVPHYERVARLAPFTDPIRQLIHKMKYRHRWPIAEFFADRIFEGERLEGMLFQTDVIVPIPLHPWRQIARGYNQAEVFARRIAGLCDRTLAQPLVRLRNTKTQIYIHAIAKREENVRGAFALIDARAIEGKHVLVIDDVMTTGATLQSAARELARAKPASLCALTIAIADPKRRDFQSI